MIATDFPREFRGDISSVESDLPFWDKNTNWLTTIIKTLEIDSGFQSTYFQKEGEQDWLFKNHILTRNKDDFNPRYLAVIGHILYESLFPADSSIKHAFLESLRLAEEQNADLDLRLKFEADSGREVQLADYPWELLYDGERFLLHHNVSISRYIVFEACQPNLPPQEKLRVLLVSASPQKFDLLPDHEIQAIYKTLEETCAQDNITLEFLRHSTTDTLREYLRKAQKSNQLPHILHFDGHGVFGRRCGSYPSCNQFEASLVVDHCRLCGRTLSDPLGYLIFEDEYGNPDYVSTKEFTGLLPRTICLVLLSACQSGMTLTADSIFSGTAQNLINHRFPAVVAMQYNVRAKAARYFAEEFYRALGQKEPLVTALHEGRLRMGVDENQWYRPVLYLRWKDDEGGLLFNKQRVYESVETRRCLEAAMPKKSKVGQTTEVRVMIAQYNSLGLRAYLTDPTESDELITKGDVSKSDITINFKLNETTNSVESTVVCITIEAHGFEIDSSQKKIEVSPHCDSGVVTFLLIPKKRAKHALVKVEAIEDEIVLGSLTLITEVLGSQDQLIELGTTIWKFATNTFGAIIPDVYPQDSRPTEAALEKSSLSPPPPPYTQLETFEFMTATIVCEEEEARFPEIAIVDFENAWIEFNMAFQRLAIQRRPLQCIRFVENLDDPLTLPMILVPGGIFIMGCPHDEGGKECEEPQHTVSIRQFFLSRSPITQAQWRFIAGFPIVNRELNPDPSQFKGYTRPVENISWYDAIEFCDRLSYFTGKKYRLPTEAEWEYACRAGTTTPFNVGETITTELANYNGNITYGRGSKGVFREETTPVDYFGYANPFGISDMHGNVWEWCWDIWNDNYQGAPIDGSAWLSEYDHDYRVIRGGSWDVSPEYCRSSSRSKACTDVTDFRIGLRVACSNPVTFD